MLTKETLINMITNAGTINIDIDEEAPELIDELPDFNTMANRVSLYSHTTDWDEGRIITVDTSEGKITMLFIVDSLCAIIVEELPLTWYFSHSRDRIMMKEEIHKLFA